MAGKLKDFLKKFEDWRVLIGLIIAVVPAVYGVAAWVRTVSQNAVLDEKFLATLASRIRPACIFDSRGTIEADLGAEDYIQDIRVTPTPQTFGFEILIKAKRHLAYAPLVSAIGANLFTYAEARTNLNDWLILMTPQSTINVVYFSNGSASMDTNTVYRFKLEILH